MNLELLILIRQMVCNFYDFNVKENFVDLSSFVLVLKQFIYPLFVFHIV